MTKTETPTVWTASELEAVLRERTNSEQLDAKPPLAPTLIRWANDGKIPVKEWLKWGKSVVPLFAADEETVKAALSRKRWRRI